MAVCSVKEKKELFKAIKHTSNLNKAQEIDIKRNFTSEFQDKVEQAIEANNLCYNCETGFHYMKQ